MNYRFLTTETNSKALYIFRCFLNVLWNSADSSAENKFISPMSVQTRSLGFHWRKASTGVHSPWFWLILHWEQNFQYWQLLYMYCLWTSELGAKIQQLARGYKMNIFASWHEPAQKKILCSLKCKNVLLPKQLFFVN